MKRVLITNGDNIRTLMFFRAINTRADLEVHVAAERKFTACILSRHCRHYIINTNPKKDKKKFLSELSRYCSEQRIDVLIPMNADELEIILSNKKLFPKTEVPFAPYQAFHRMKDKWEFYKLAVSCNVRSPETMMIEKPSDLEKVRKFPAIVKIRTGAGSKGVQKVEGRDELRKVFNKIVSDYKLSKDKHPIVQEYINGELMCVAALCRHGKVVSVSAYKSLRQLPIEHGTSTSRVSIKDEKACKDAKRILERLRWHGIAHFDIIKSNAEHYFLEMNPRFYTSLNVTVQSGLNYPYYACTLDDQTRVPKDYRPNVKCRVLMADSMVFLRSMFRKDKYPLREFLEFGKDVHIDDFSMSDPLPSLALMVKFARGKLL